jgi:hypothetical protein
MHVATKNELVAHFIQHSGGLLHDCVWALLGHSILPGLDPTRKNMEQKLNRIELWRSSWQIDYQNSQWSTIHHVFPKQVLDNCRLCACVNHAIVHDEYIVVIKPSANDQAFNEQQRKAAASPFSSPREYAMFRVFPGLALAMANKL